MRRWPPRAGVESASTSILDLQLQEWGGIRSVKLSPARGVLLVTLEVRPQPRPVPCGARAPGRGLDFMGEARSLVLSVLGSESRPPQGSHRPSVLPRRRSSKCAVGTARCVNTPARPCNARPRERPEQGAPGTHGTHSTPSACFQLRARAQALHSEIRWDVQKSSCLPSPAPHSPCGRVHSWGKTRAAALKVHRGAAVPPCSGADPLCSHSSYTY